MKLSFAPKGQPPPPPPLDLILASQSIGRRSLLEKLGLRFRVVVTRVNEDALVHTNPLKTVQKRAAAKTEEVINNPRVYSIPDDRQVLVIAADSMAILGKHTLGKPHDREEAKTILKELMAKTHIFVTAMQLVYLESGVVKKRWEKVAKTKVTLKKLTPAETESYLSRYDLTRFAGAYAFNEAPWDIISKIDGSYTNVIGLPFEALLPILRQLKIII